MDPADITGSVGVGLLLLAFGLNALGSLDRRSRPYLGLNLVGAGLACYSALLIGFVPFVVLEGAWALVAAVGLARTATA